MGVREKKDNWNAASRSRLTNNTSGSHLLRSYSLNKCQACDRGRQTSHSFKDASEGRQIKAGLDVC